MHRHLQSSTQLPVRISVLLIVALVYLAFRIGLDVLLGAFAAGIVIRLLVRGDDSPVVRGKLEAIGFGLLVPIFFITSGMQFNLHALTSSSSGLLRVPLFLVLFLAVRGTPALLLYRRDLTRRELVPLAFLSVTGLPLIVVITTIGVSEGRMLPINASSLVAAGMLSALLYPMTARFLLRRPAASGSPRLNASRVDAGQGDVVLRYLRPDRRLRATLAMVSLPGAWVARRTQGDRGRS